MFPAEPPPPQIDRASLLEQSQRIRRRRALRGLFLAAVLLSTVASVWILSAGEIPTRSEWAFAATQVGELQARGLDGRGQVVCLVDTGIDETHPSLKDAPVLAWRDFVAGRATPYDDDGHGTAMAGILAGRGPLRGVAPAATLIVAKALDAQGVGSSASLASAILFCADPNGDGDGSDGATVISLSLAAAHPFPIGTDVADAVASAVAKGIFVVASAGNDGVTDDGDVQSPASIPDVIAVGAVDVFGAVARFSSMGADAGRADPDRKPEVVAPGADVLSASRGGTYRLVSGTSASAAFVSGTLALLLQDRPGLARSGGPAAIHLLKAALMQTAKKEPAQAVPHDPRYGYGLVQAVDLDAAL